VGSKRRGSFPLAGRPFGGIGYHLEIHDRILLQGALLNHDGSFFSQYNNQKMKGFGFMTSLGRQHEVDLIVYRSAHQLWKNRALHWVLIPVECWSLFLVAYALLPPWIPFLVAIFLGVMAFWLALYPKIGFACLVFHIMVIGSCSTIIEHWKTWETLSLASIAWIFSWTVQVGVGHWLWEKNDPNVANMASVSWLAMCQSDCLE
jgi:uncharacterized membrane protein YGL010W